MLYERDAAQDELEELVIQLTASARVHILTVYPRI